MDEHPYEQVTLNELSRCSHVRDLFTVTRQLFVTILNFNFSRDSDIFPISMWLIIFPGRTSRIPVRMKRVAIEVARSSINI